MVKWARNLLTRIGGMIIAPGVTVDAALDEQRGGLFDLLALLLLQVVAVHLSEVVRTVLFMVDVNATNGLLLLGNFIARSMTKTVLATLVGTAVIASAHAAHVLAQRREQKREGKSKSDGGGDGEPETPALLPSFDVSAMCALPVVVLQIVVAFVARVGGPVMPPRWLDIASVAWFVVLLFVARARVRARAGQR